MKYHNTTKLRNRYHNFEISEISVYFLDEALSPFTGAPERRINSTQAFKPPPCARGQRQRAAREGRLNKTIVIVTIFRKERRYTPPADRASAHLGPVAPLPGVWVGPLRSERFAAAAEIQIVFPACASEPPPCQLRAPIERRPSCYRSFTKYPARELSGGALAATRTSEILRIFACDLFFGIFPNAF